MDQEKLKQNPKLRKKLRSYGWIILFIGILLFVIAVIDFFSGFNNMRMPSLSWLFFIAIPLIAVGSRFLSYGYMGAVSRYKSSEISPVAKDTINYLLDGTKESISGVVSEIKGNKQVVVCQACNEPNDHDAKFCKKCGTKVSKTCPNCQTENDQDARFCDNCGGKLDEK